jgi:outer membrane receptor protein involved in Fe transport
VNLGVPASYYGKVSENPANQYNTLGGGNPNLTPETANTYTLGFVISPKKLPGFTAAIDYYNIKIDSTIGSLAADDILRQCAATGNPTLCGLVHRDATGSLWKTTLGYTLSANANVGKLNSEGLDINATYTKALGTKGLFSVNLIGTYLRKQTIDTGLYSYDCVGFFGNQCGIPTPTWRHLARFSWETPYRTTISVGWRMIGHALVDAASPNPALAGSADDIALYKANNIYELPKTHYMDLGVTYKLAKSYTLIGGINNLFDKEPPLAPGMSPNDYGTGFYGTYDPLGRYFHWSLQFSF